MKNGDLPAIMRETAKDTSWSQANSQLRAGADAIEGLQKQLDDLKVHNDQLQSLLSTQDVSLNKIKAEAVRDWADQFDPRCDAQEHVVSDAYDYANQLEGKE